VRSISSVESRGRRTGLTGTLTWWELCDINTNICQELEFAKLFMIQKLLKWQVLWQ